VYQDTARSASLLGAKGALDMMTECYRRIEDNLLNQELNPMTTRQRQIEAQLKHAQAQRAQARLQLTQGIREACEADLAGALGLLSELHLMIEDLHHERLEALQPH
jgi:multidrug resistance efflux pump